MEETEREMYLMEIKDLDARLQEAHTLLNEVSLNGDGSTDEVEPGKFVRKGGYFRKRVLTGNRNRNEKPKEENLGAPVKIVFLRKRRKLVERGGTDGQILRQ